MDDRRFRGEMVTDRKAQPVSPAMLTIRMIFYYFSFLAAVLIGLPMLFDWLGTRILSRNPWPDMGIADQIVGGALFVVSIVGYTICSLWLVIVGKGPFVEFDPPREFVATGPYKWCRNPVVVFLLLTVAGEALYFESIGILCLFLLGLPFAHFQATRIEEPNLTRRFGDSYRDYCNRVPRWLPKRPTNDPTP